MTCPPDLVEAVCSRCGTVYTTYLRPTVDRELEPWGEEGMSPATRAACPECGAELGHDDALEPHAIGPHPSRARHTATADRAPGRGRLPSPPDRRVGTLTVRSR